MRNELKGRKGKILINEKDSKIVKREDGNKWN